MSVSMDEERQDVTNKIAPKKLPPGIADLHFAGELILPKCSDRSYSGLFRRFEAIFELFANMDRPVRMLNYRFFCGMLLTSHAKKSEDPVVKKELFDLKNQLFLNIANDPIFKRQVAFRYLVSKHFRVLDYCAKCTATNTEQSLDRRKWHHCKSCKVDRNFYNILCMHHRFDKGTANLFLSHDLIERIAEFRMPRKAKLEDYKEEIRFEKYGYNVRNIDAISLASARKLYQFVMPAGVEKK